MVGGNDIHGAGSDNSPVLLPEHSNASRSVHHDSLDAGGGPVLPLASSFDQPFSFLAVYRPRSQAIRIYPIGVEPPFDAPVDLSEAQAHALCAELRRALDVPGLAEQLVRGGR